jgi:hypothetical protein
MRAALDLTLDRAVAKLPMQLTAAKLRKPASQREAVA